MPSFKLNKLVKALAVTSLPLALALIPLPSFAQTALQCQADVGDAKVQLVNNASYEYSVSDKKYFGISNSLSNQLIGKQVNLKVAKNNITDAEGNLILGVGTIADALEAELEDSFLKQLSSTERETVINTAIARFLTLSENTSIEEGLSQVIAAITSALPPEKANLANQISTNNILIALSNTSVETLKVLGLNTQQAQNARATALNTITGLNATSSFWQARQDIFASITIGLDTEVVNSLEANQTLLESELKVIREGGASSITQGDTVNYEFVFANQGLAQATLDLPNAATLQSTGLEGPGQIVAVKYQKSKISTGEVITEGDITEQGTPLVLQPQEQVKIVAITTVGNLSTVSSTSLSLGLATDCTNGENEPIITSPTLSLITVLDPLTDPFGQISGCGGALLEDYRGFVVGIFDVDPVIPTEITSLTELTTTELPDDPNNAIPKGIEPNIQNSNPFFLTNQDDGKYSFLFDESMQQLDKGREYILIVKPPEDSIYDERRIKITIGETFDNIVQYTARSLDGKPISVADPLQRTEITGEIVLVEDADRIGLDIGVLDLGASICEEQEIRIDKTGDRANAEPGDTVLYRLIVRNLSVSDIETVKLSDILPAGFRFLENSVKAAVGEEIIDLEVSTNKQDVDFVYNGVLETGETLTLVYAAQLTPDSLRGSGKNLANVSATRLDNGLTLNDGPAIHTLDVEPGIVANCGTIIGRVFVDKNFDGEQQPGEPGVANAIIFLEDGNRISTDENGLFTVANILPGYHTGVLDLTSVPGYALAPNLRFIEKNSQSRLVRLAPGSIVKMNFAVTPAFGEENAP